MKTLKNVLNAAGFSSTADAAAARADARKLRDSLFREVWAADSLLALARKGKRSTKAAKAAKADAQGRLNAAVIACR